MDSFRRLNPGFSYPTTRYSQTRFVALFRSAGTRKLFGLGLIPLLNKLWQFFGSRTLTSLLIIKPCLFADGRIENERGATFSSHFLLDKALHGNGLTHNDCVLLFRPSLPLWVSHFTFECYLDLLHCYSSSILTFLLPSTDCLSFALILVQK